MAERTRVRLSGLLLAVACTARCAPHHAPSAAPPGPRLADRVVVLNEHPLQLHVAPGTRGPGHPLLVYATGDGGWHRKDLATYRYLVSFGDPTAGFDAHDYVTHLGRSETTTPGRLAADYERIITAAKETLHLPVNYPVVLVGVSRGAGLSVVAAAQRPPQSSIAGVLAVALTKEEEYVTADVYPYLPRLAGMPVAVIQSTRDHYLPAAAARALFGPDRPDRWFQAIPARNHSFGGARDELYAAIGRSLRWISPSSSASSPPSPAVPRG